MAKLTRKAPTRAPGAQEAPPKVAAKATVTTARPSGAELAKRVTAEPAKPVAGLTGGKKPEKPFPYGVSFMVSAPLAKLIGELADAGQCSIHTLFARMIRDAGHDVPAIDLEPPKPGRRRTYDR